MARPFCASSKAILSSTGRGGEEVAFFRAQGLAEKDGKILVLPGITSALSAPLFAGVPVTQRDVADQLLVCTGTGKKGKAPEPPGYKASRTVVFLMALHRIAGLVGELTTHTPELEEQASRERKEEEARKDQTMAAAQNAEQDTTRFRRRLWPSKHLAPLLSARAARTNG